MVMLTARSPQKVNPTPKKIELETVLPERPSQSLVFLWLSVWVLNKNVSNEMRHIFPLCLLLLFITVYSFFLQQNQGNLSAFLTATTLLLSMVLW